MIILTKMSKKVILTFLQKRQGMKDPDQDLDSFDLDMVYHF